VTALPPHLAGPGVIALRHGAFELGLAPELGGSIVYFVQHRPEGIRHWFRPASPAAFAAATGHQAACFPLVPVSGRIADAVLNWEHRTLRLPRNVDFEGNHLHGEGWQRPWLVEEHDRSAAVLVLPHGSAEWPFAYAARFRYALANDGLTVDMAVTNTGVDAMPAAIGIHPWFPAPLAELTAQADTLWEIDARKLFVAKVPPPPHRRFAAGRSLAGSDLEHGFSGWDGTAALRWPDRPGHLVMTASRELAHLVVYTREPFGDFCVEPVSCSVDAFNLDARGVEGTGTVRLPSGGTLSATARFAVEG